jgi:hypothetical protein
MTNRDLLPGRGRQFVLIGIALLLLAVGCERGTQGLWAWRRRL